MSKMQKILLETLGALTKYTDVNIIQFYGVYDSRGPSVAIREGRRPIRKYRVHNEGMGNIFVYDRKLSDAFIYAETAMPNHVFIETTAGILAVHPTSPVSYEWLEGFEDEKQFNKVDSALKKELGFLTVEEYKQLQKSREPKQEILVPQ